MLPSRISVNLDRYDHSGSRRATVGAVPNLMGSQVWRFAISYARQRMTVNAGEEVHKTAGESAHSVWEASRQRATTSGRPARRLGGVRVAEWSLASGEAVVDEDSQ